MKKRKIMSISVPMNVFRKLEDSAQRENLALSSLVVKLLSEHFKEEVPLTYRKSWIYKVPLRYRKAARSIYKRLTEEYPGENREGLKLAAIEDALRYGRAVTESAET